MFARYRTYAARALNGASLIALAALFLGAAAAAAAGDSTDPKRPKASSFAPHHTRSHVYGTPVSKPILHKRKKRKPPAAPAGAPAEPIK
jgi:hypothetical protein